MDQQGLAVSIENLTPYTIRDCHLYFANRLFSVGNIVPDSKSTKRIPERIIWGTEELRIDAIKGPSTKMISGSPTTFADRMRIDLMTETLKRIHSRHSNKKDVVFLLGMIDSNVVPTRLKGYKGHLKEFGLLELEIKVNYKET